MFPDNVMTSFSNCFDTDSPEQYEQRKKELFKELEKFFAVQTNGHQAFLGQMFRMRQFELILMTLADQRSAEALTKG